MNRKRLVSVAVPLLLLVVSALACGPGGSKPTVSIIAPSNGSQIAVGQTVEVHFRAEDEKAVAWVQMMVNDSVVATQQSPLAAGQTPLEGILRWTPSAVGTFNLILTARSTTDQDSDPAAVSITVVEAIAGRPTPTPMSTPVPQGPTPTRPSGQPTATARPGQPTATTRPGQPTATTRPTQPASQPTATTRPTQPPPPTAVPPTKTPPPTPVLPVIDYFYADTYVISVNDCATIYWATTNATEVHLRGDLAPASGEHTFCYFDLGPGITLFELAAVRGSETATEHLEIEAVEPQEVQLTAAFVPAESGSVAENGAVSDSIFPGDDQIDNKDWIGFVSFDTSNLPPGATIVSADLDLGPCSVSGDPFSDLVGPLYVTYLYYGDLDAGDYSATGGDYVASVYGCPAGVFDVASSLQAHMDPPRYQVTLSWPVRSDFDGEVDDVTYTAPVLYITYIP